MILWFALTRVCRYEEQWKIYGSITSLTVWLDLSSRESKLTMMSGLKVEYQPLANCRSISVGAGTSVIGVVVDTLAPLQTSAKDHNWMQTFSIWDASLAEEQKFGQKVRFFKNTPAELPSVGERGDVIVLQDVGFYKAHGETTLKSIHCTRWTIFSAKTLAALRARPTRVVPSDFKSDSKRAPLLTDFTTAFALYQKWTAQNNGAGPLTPLDGPSPLMPKVEGSGNKFCLLQDIRDNSFHDLIVHVLKMYNSGNGIVTIHVSDYSPHEKPGLYPHQDPLRPDAGATGDYPDYMEYDVGTSKAPDGFRRPFGKRTLQVSLFPPHSTYAVQHLVQGSYALLKNVQVKYQQGYLEGFVRTDKRYPDRVYVTAFKEKNADPRLEELLGRRREYWRKYDLNSKEATLQKMGLNPKRKPDPIAVSEQRVSKKARKKQKYLAEAESRPTTSTTTTTTAKQKHKKPAGNQNLVCSHQHVETTPLSEILAGTSNHHTFAGTDTLLPFHNVNYRARVRVIDFFPDQLEDFAVKVRRRPFDALSPSSGDGGSDSDSGQDLTAGSLDKDCEWEWRFGLRVEDARAPPKKDEREGGGGGRRRGRAEMVLWVCNEDAQGLLGSDACDLRGTPRKLRQLKERLFTLWGDLEEVKGRRRERDQVLGGGIEAELRALRREDGEEESEESRVANLPFDCCVREYGVRQKGERGGMGGWQRHFQMYGVIIQDGR